MNRSIFGRAALSAAVVFGLGFGMREAVASAPAAAARPYCRDTAHCNEICSAEYGPDTQGICSSGHTCYCYF